MDYVIDNKDCLVRVDTKLIEGWDVCPDLKLLKTYASPAIENKPVAGLKWKGGHIPATLMKRILGTMKAFPNKETLYTLYHNPRTLAWHADSPTQVGRGASVSGSDENSKLPDGFYYIGTVHSHPNMRAFWSGTDHKDQDSTFGLHFVFGLTEGRANSVLCSIFTTSSKYDQEFTDVCEAVDFQETMEADPGWVKIIEAQTYVPAPRRPEHDFRSFYTEDRSRTRYSQKWASGARGADRVRHCLGTYGDSDLLPMEGLQELYDTKAMDTKAGVLNSLSTEARAYLLSLDACMKHAQDLTFELESLGAYEEGLKVIQEFGYIREDADGSDSDMFGTSRPDSQKLAEQILRDNLCSTKTPSEVPLDEDPEKLLDVLEWVLMSLSELGEETQTCELLEGYGFVSVDSAYDDGDN